MKSLWMFSERRDIPYKFSKLCLPYIFVKYYVFLFGKYLKVNSWQSDGCPFYKSYVGIMLMHKDIYADCEGYDEKLLYWGWMEVDFALRAQKKYKLLDLGKIIPVDFYHLDHAAKGALGQSSGRKQNPKIKNNVFKPNGENWGMVNEPIGISSWIK